MSNGIYVFKWHVTGLLPDKYADQIKAVHAVLGRHSVKATFANGLWFVTGTKIDCEETLAALRKEGNGIEIGELQST